MSCKSHARIQKIFPGRVGSGVQGTIIFARKEGSKPNFGHLICEFKNFEFSTEGHPLPSRFVHES